MPGLVNDTARRGPARRSTRIQGRWSRSRHCGTEALSHPDRVVFVGLLFKERRIRPCAPVAAKFFDEFRSPFRVANAGVLRHLPPLVSDPMIDHARVAGSGLGVYAAADARQRRSGSAMSELGGAVSLRIALASASANSRISTFRRNATSPGAGLIEVGRRFRWVRSLQSFDEEIAFDHDRLPLAAARSVLPSMRRPCPDCAKLFGRYLRIPITGTDESVQTGVSQPLASSAARPDAVPRHTACGGRPCGADAEGLGGEDVTAVVEPR